MNNQVMPMQPIYKTKQGHVRFLPNRIVDKLLEVSPIGLNEIACMNFTQQEREQFAQLIGYSLSGFSELSYVSEETYRTAEIMQTEPPNVEMNDLTARNLALRGLVEALTEKINEFIGNVSNLIDDQ